MTEQWRPVKGYEGRYEVCDTGAVWSVRAKTLMLPTELKVGYLAIGLWDGERTKTHYMHRLVAEHFLPDPPAAKGYEVCHYDGDRLNNAVGNLRWGTRADNMRDAVRHGTHHQSGKTHCKRGHEFTDENTQTNDRGHRRCLTCQRAHQRAYRNRSAA